MIPSFQPTTEVTRRAKTLPYRGKRIDFFRSK